MGQSRIEGSGWNEPLDPKLTEQLPDEVLQYLARQDDLIRQLQQTLVACQERSGLDADQQREQLQSRLIEAEQDRSDLRKKNQQLEELVKNKEGMMYMMVHDMKNPLTVVMGALILSQNARFEMDPTLKDLLRDAHIQSIKLRAMMDDILNISRMSSAEFQIEAAPADLIALAQQSVMMMDMVKGSRKLKLKLIAGQDSLMVDLDYPLIERVLNNLISNAIKYAPEESELLLEIEVIEKEVRVSVTNWGEAIPAEAHLKIFEMFGRAKPKDKRVEGTGLGLAFCKSAIAAHHGKIWVVSPVPPNNYGTRFYFTLPLTNPRDSGAVAENLA